MIIEELDNEIERLILTHRKINKSLLAEKYGVDRHTIDRHIKIAEGGTKERKKRQCGLLKYYEIIENQFKVETCIKSVYMYVLNISSFEEIGTYSNFKQYVERHFNDIRKETKDKIVKYRFETPPGDQLQFDWVENIKLHLQDGTLIIFNIWSATLGYSRRHIFKVVFSLTEATFKKCLIETLIIIGGSINRVLTDNMSAIVNINRGNKKIHPTVIQFMKDLDIKLELCKVRHAYTKGKVEVSNKYQNWLSPYDYKFKTKQDLIKGVEEILDQSNYQKNSETKVAPMVLYELEKPKLKKLPNKELLIKYHSDFIKLKVSNSCLVQYNGAKYGLPSQCINKQVLLDNSNDLLTFYDLSLNKLTVYPVYDSGIHYSEGLYSICKMKGESEENYKKRVGNNLKLLAGIGKQK